MPSLNYNHGIKNVLKNLNVNVSINKSASIILNDLLNDVNSKLLQYCETKYKNMDKRKYNNLSVALDAVSNIFPGELKNNAKAEGHRAIIMFHSGFLSYKLKTPISAEFGNAVSQYAKIMYPEAKLDNSASYFIDKLLNELILKVSDAAVETAKDKNKIELVDLKNALKSSLPEVIQHHAFSEGHKKVFQYESKMFHFSPGSEQGDDKEYEEQISNQTAKRKLKRKKVKKSESQVSRKKAKKSPSKIVTRKTIDFSRGLKKVSRDVNKRLSMKKGTISLINDILNEINYKLVDHCNSNIESLSGDQEIGINIPEYAIQYLFPGELLHHALAEANKDVFKFEHAMISYNPKERKPKEAKITKDLMPKMGFVHGLRSLTSVSFSGAKLDNPSKQYVDSILQSLVKNIFDQAKTLSQSKATIDDADICNASEKALPKEMQQHAHSEGAKAIIKYELGLIPFKPIPHKMKSKKSSTSVNDSQKSN